MRAVRGAQLELSFAAPTSRHSPERASAAGSGLSRAGLIDAHRKRISGFLSMLLPDPVDVVFTDNRSTMVSFKHRIGRLEVRLHRMFRHAGEGLLKTLARFIASSDSRSSAELDRFIERHADEIRARRSPAAKQDKTGGRHFDPQQVLDEVCQTYFGGPVDVSICWGRTARRRKSRRGRTRSRALATYSFDDRTIRLSPVLDSAGVPLYVVEWIVYHELLHHVLPVERSGGRSRYHTSRFKALERAFESYEEAKRWEEENLEWLLR
jgi:hypothetical protein